jgi:putative photosynthetic complex assembly protein
MTELTHGQISTDTPRETIPKGLLIMMFALAMSALAITTFAVVTGRPTVGRPAEAAVTASRGIVLEGHGAKAVTVRDPSGEIIADLSHGGFVAVVQNGLERARMVKGVTGNPPVDLVAYANGRLAVIDPATGWSVELGIFGADNRAAFARLLPQ